MTMILSCQYRTLHYEICQILHTLKRPRISIVFRISDRWPSPGALARIRHIRAFSLPSAPRNQRHQRCHYYHGPG